MGSILHTAQNTISAVNEFVPKFLLPAALASYRHRSVTCPIETLRQLKLPSAKITPKSLGMGLLLSFLLR